jgi:hypothetical protein
VFRKLLIGPTVTGLGWLAGSHYGANAQQLVHKSPAETYQAVSDAFSNTGDHGTTAFAGGKPMPYELRYDRQPGQQIVLHVLFAGREGATAEIDFTPQGTDTLMTAKAHGDRAVLSDALAGTANARVAYAPDWMLNLLMVRPLLKQLGEQIEAGRPPQIVPQSQADWESSLPPDEQQQVQDYRQYEATAPTTDPDAAAQNYLNGASN